MNKEHKNMRKLHIDGEIWQYKIHASIIELRSPLNKKHIIESFQILPKQRPTIIDEYCYDSMCGDEYTLYEDPRDNKKFSTLKGTEPYNNKKTIHFFALTPSRIKTYIINNLCKSG